jgi:hydrogenase/urease accessory protein HupE
MVQRYWYLQWGNGLTFNALLLVWLCGLGVLCGFSWRLRHRLGATAAYAIALTGVGLLMMFSSNLFGEFLPRYALPMWELLIVSSLLVLGQLLTLPWKRLPVWRSARTEGGHSQPAGLLKRTHD